MGPVGGGRFMELSCTIKKKYGLDINIPKLALKFVLSNPNVDFALTGVSTLEMLEENVHTVCGDIHLTDEEKMIIGCASEEFGNEDFLRCTGCGYCMPCPKKVDIPANLKIMKYIKIWDLKKEAEKLYLLKMQHANFKSAHSCLGCKICEKKCPQKIPISNQLNSLKQIFNKGEI
jgi:predicted aldo/keto reductase-like oxidoreductase